MRWWIRCSLNPSAQGGKEAGLAKEVRGQVAIASAKMAYQIYKEIFGGDRFRGSPARGLARNDCSGPAPAPRTRSTVT